MAIKPAISVRPVKTARDYQQALKRIETLMNAVSGTKAGDELDVLVTLVEAYEAKHHRVFPPDPVEAIKFRMEQMGLTRKELEPLIGGRGQVSEVLSRRRSLSLDMIRRLHTKLAIPLESLLGTAA